MQLTAREATIADLGILAVMNKQLIEDENSANTMNLSQLEERMRGFMDRGWTVVIAEEEQQPVGYVTFTIGTDEYEPHRARVHVGHYFIRRERRRMGYGKEFFYLLEDQFFPYNSKVVLDVLVDNYDAQGFYKSLGFAPYSIMMEKA